MAFPSPNAIVQPRVGELVAKPDDVITPNNTALMVDAFRKGAITSQEILDRSSELTKKKKDLDLMQTNNAIALEPAMQQARVTGVEAKRKADLAAIFKAEAAPGSHEKMLEALAANGYPVQVSLENGLSESDRKEIERRFGLLQVYSRELLKSEDEAKQAGKVDWVKSADGSQELPRIMVNGSVVDMNQAKALIQKYTSMKATPFSIWANLPDGGGSSPAQVVQPGGTSRAPVMATAGFVQPSAQPVVVATAPAPAPVAVAPVGAVVTPRYAPAGTVTPEGGFSLGTPVSPDKAPTEAQQRALLAAGRFEEADKLLKSAGDSGFDPTTVFQYVEQHLPNLLKSEGRQQFDAAVDLWSQGLLRLESGAAISRQEKVWYERAFFPQPGDSASVVLAKEKARKDTEAMVGRVGGAGPIPEEIKAEARALYATANALTTAKPASPTGGKVYNIGGISAFRDPKTGAWIKVQ